MSKELAKTYDPKAIEEKLYERWCENKYFHAEVDRSRKPFTTVMPPPNITGKQCTVASGNRPCGYFYRGQGYEPVKRRGN